LDCPGIVFGTNPTADVVLRNCVKLEQIPDVIEPIEAIFKRCRPEQLSQIYQIPVFNTAMEFLTFIAQKRGKLLKGGRINIQAAGKSVLQDWNSGKIPFYTIPPKKKDVHISAEIVSDWSKAFDIGSIGQAEDAMLNNLSRNSENMMEMEAGTADTFQDEDEVDEMNDEDDDEEGDLDEEGDEMNDEDGASDMSGRTMVSDDIIRRREAAAALANSGTGAKKLASLFPEEASLNPQKNKLKKQELKRNRKLKQKNTTAVLRDDAEMQDEDDNGSDAFDFSKAFAFKRTDDDDDGEDDDIDIEDI